jgi:hypothetical protein
MEKVWQKAGWAKFWAIFSPTHLVTLAAKKVRCWSSDGEMDNRN